MASGVKVHDDVVTCFKEINVHHHGDDLQERYKFLVFCIEESHIVVDKKATLKVKDLEGVTDVFKKVIGQLPVDECRYGVYDCHYETKDSPKEDLVFIYWAPEGSPIKSKMLYASSKNALKKVFHGLKYEWQLHDIEESKDSKGLIDKLAGPTNCCVKTLEGKVV